ncbi:DUF4365 domain-containing protein [Nitrospira moscoviensis]|uniref:DUF4365 domain-containing protein n=1 Tax=Nitrospira moscoviensis TaxID=42253 RepID=A0A0K2GHL4_NITMO|nr:DUF4365 domain-containing protein [Nitrospira moscoviensis]ALA60122.1 hypothetical protein NITMOv2_3731 [Nitrospira moscoviensis]
MQNPNDIPDKVAHPASFIGQNAINLIATIVARMGHLWSPTNSHSDIGIDGYIELCRESEGGKRTGTNFIIQVQSKGTDKPWAHEDATGFVFKVDLSDLKHWLAGNQPVILVVSRPASSEAYWISVKDYFSSLEAKKTRTIYFKKSLHRFDESASHALQRLAVPHSSGISLDQPPKSEVLHSNALPLIRYPQTIFRAKTRFKIESSVRDKAEALGLDIGREWFLKDGMVTSFLSLNGEAWRQLLTQKAVETISTSTLSDSDSSDSRNDFVRLLNYSLTSFLRVRGLRRFKINRQKSLYYFRAGRESIERKIKWGARSVERTVVQTLYAKTDPSRVLCYRHTGFISRFLKLGQNWHLVVEPTYHFTVDGQKEYALREEYLSGIKRFEKHQAVSNNIKFWAHFLSYSDLFQGGSDLLAFGPALEYQCPDGIVDSDWLSHADDEEKEILGADLIDDSQMSLL